MLERKRSRRAWGSRARWQWNTSNKRKHARRGRVVRKLRFNAPSWEELTSSEIEDLVSLVPDPSSYSWKPGTEAPLWLPFRSKLVDMLCLRSDTSLGMFFMANGRRLDLDRAKGQ